MECSAVLVLESFKELMPRCIEYEVWLSFATQLVRGRHAVRARCGAAFNVCPQYGCSFIIPADVGLRL